MKPFINGTRHYGNLSLAENLYSPENPRFKQLYKTEPGCYGEKYHVPLRFRNKQVSLYVNTKFFFFNNSTNADTETTEKFEVSFGGGSVPRNCT